MKSLLAIAIVTLALDGCAARKPAAAHLVVPPECVDEIRLTRPLDLNQDGATARKGSFSVRYHCSRVANTKCAK